MSTRSVESSSISAETWIQSGHHVFTIDGGMPIASATIDPDHRIPDRDRANNSWTAP